jgi:photosystem II stability/assembly factor-like uncharacterized protein
MVSILRFVLWGFALLTIIAFNAAAQRKPEPRMIARWDVQPTGVNDDLTTVYFVNENLGFAAGKNNTIIRTTDGGKTWKRLLERREGGPEYDQLIFINEKEGWLREHDALLHTTDSGDTWQAAAKLSRQMDYGYGAGSAVGSSWFQLDPEHTGVGLYRTDDGGKIWQKAGEVPENSYQDLFFFDAKHGWVVGRYLKKSIAYTTDGGATWTGITQEVSETTNKIRFASPTTGWAFGKNGSFVLASSDGGKTWKQQPTGLPDYRPPVDISVLSERQVFICTTEAVLSTSNGSDSWKVIGNFRSETISALSFPDSSHGWVVGIKGFVSHYHLVPVIQPR